MQIYMYLQFFYNKALHFLFIFCNLLSKEINITTLLELKTLEKLLDCQNFGDVVRVLLHIFFLNLELSSSI